MLSNFLFLLLSHMFLMQLVIVMVWITSGVYSIPKFIFVRTITNDLGNGQTETICIAHRKAYNAELFDLINFALLYILPLLVMTVSIVYSNNLFSRRIIDLFFVNKHKRYIILLGIGRFKLKAHITGY